VECKTPLELENILLGWKELVEQGTKESVVVAHMSHSPSGTALVEAVEVSGVVEVEQEEEKFVPSLVEVVLLELE
jgi:hypothetical protein